VRRKKFGRKEKRGVMQAASSEGRTAAFFIVGVHLVVIISLSLLSPKVRHCKLAQFPFPIADARRVRFERLLATAVPIASVLVGVLEGYCVL